MDYLVEYYSLILYNPALKSIFIVLTSIISAKVVDIIFTIVFKKIVDKTDTELDNKIIYLLHRPIFYSVLFVGIIIAVKTASLPDYIDFALIGVFKTLTILIWFFVGTKILVISTDWAKNINTAPNIISMAWWPTYPTPSDWFISLFKTQTPTIFNLSYYSNPSVDF